MNTFLQVHDFIFIYLPGVIAFCVCLGDVLGHVGSVGIDLHMHENLMKLPKHESATFYDKNSNRTGTGHGLDGST